MTYERKKEAREGMLRAAPEVRQAAMEALAAVAARRMRVLGLV